MGPLEMSSPADSLAEARRLDWRFLLRSPEIGRVAYLGSPDAGHARALRRFADGVVLVEAEAAVDPHLDTGSFDVVVLGNPTRPECVAARELLGPDGVLYAEVDVPAARKRPGAMRSSTAVVRELHRAGIAELTIYWHWPSFESCTQITPLGDRRVLEYVLERRRNEPGAATKVIVARALLRLRLLSRFLTHTSVVGHLPGGSTRPR